jgi:hypothetical protein
MKLWEENEWVLRATLDLEQVRAPWVLLCCCEVQWRWMFM